MPPVQPSKSAAAVCPHAPECVGCALIGTPYGRQLERKRERVLAALAEYPRLAAVAVGAMVGSPRVFGYRNQAKLVVRRAGRGLLLGLYRPGTHQVVDITGCAVHQPLITSVLTAARAALEAADVPVYDERDGSGWLRYVVVRTSAWQRSAQIILVVRDRTWRGEQALLTRLRRVRGVISVALNPNDTRGNVIFGPRFVAVTHEAALLERVGGLKLTSRAGAFLQANIAVARRVYDRVLHLAAPQPDEIAVDLYAGVGAISFFLAGAAKQVFGVEASPLAVLDAKENIRLNGYHNVRFRAAPAAEGLAQLAAGLPRLDLITLNPPRKGADDATRAAIVAAAPTRLVYVSCEPGTLARDLDWFAERGWRIDRVDPFDMLPQTDHVECVALATRFAP